MTISVTLGRDGMGDDATEEDFRAWVDYVSEHIDAKCGFTVDVDMALKRDVQENRFTGGDEARAVIREALCILWQAWCDDDMRRAGV